MATIQIRNIPDDTYEELRAAAKERGESLQAYMLEQTVRIGRTARKRAALDALNAAWAASDKPGLTRDEILATLREIRGE